MSQFSAGSAASAGDLAIVRARKMRKETDGGRGATHSRFIYFDLERDEDAIPDRDRSTAAKPDPDPRFPQTV